MPEILRRGKNYESNTPHKKIYQDYSFSAELPRILNQSTATNIRRSFILTKKVFKELGEYIVAFPQGHDPINPGSVHTSEL